MITPDSLDIVSQLANSSNSTSTIVPDNSGPPVEMPTIWDILEQYPTYLWSKYLGLYVYPVIIFLGTVGNLISFVVMVRKTMIHSSTCFYLAVIAVVDTLVLFFSGIRSWFSVINGWDAIILSPTACKVFNFLTYFLFQYSAWLLVAMTIERFIAIHFPLKAVEFATVSRAKKVSVGLFVMFALFNCHFFWTVTISGQYCSPTEDYEGFHNDIFPLIDAALYSFLPFLVLLTINVIIIRDNKRATRFRETLRRRSHTVESEKNLENRHFHQKLTITLLSVTFTFLVTSAPRVVLFSIRFNYFDFSSLPIDFERLALYLLVSRVTSLFSYMNHAVNFLLYCITGQRFRRELRKLFVCKHQSQTAGTLYSTSTDRYRRRPSSTSISNLELSENPSYTTHISQDPSYSTHTSQDPSYSTHTSQKPNGSTHTSQKPNGSTQTSQKPNGSTQTSQKPNGSTQTELLQNINENRHTEHSQNPNTKISQNRDTVISQNNNKDPPSEFSQYLNETIHTELSQDLNENYHTELSQDLNEDCLTELSHYLNEQDSLTELSQNLNDHDCLTELSQNLNADSLTELSQNLNEQDSLTELSQNLNGDDLTKLSQNLNDHDGLTELSQNLNDHDSLTELSQNLNDHDSLTELSQNLNEDSLTELSLNLNEDSSTDLPQE